MKNLLILDDDKPWLTRLSTVFEKRGYTVTPCSSLQEAIDALSKGVFDYAVFDLRLENGTSLQIIDYARKTSPHIKLVILTGYGNFATAVAAIKQGAVNYLAKPADIDEIEAALLGQAPNPVMPQENLLSANRVKWEYIQRVLTASNQNISEAARRLKMHRRTLQRILAKHAPRG
ncbi:MAG: response regulator [Alphaproteobacteria bacterium]|nr:response regulator [Alphaproteobacteria bacterium]